MSVQRYKLEGGLREKHWCGQWIEYSAYEALESSLAEREQRIAALRTALKYEVDNCVNCDGEGRYKVMYPEYETGWAECQRCKPARAALAATEGEKP